MSTAYDRARPRSHATLRVEQLLSRYPDLKDEELAELINLFPHLDMLSLGLLAADDRLADKLGDFYRDHGDRLDRVVPLRTTVFAFAMLALMAMLWLVLA